MGDEDTLLACTDCLRKLSVDPTNADIIAASGYLNRHIIEMRDLFDTIIP